jgi:demethylmenaquinone methyltransferase/2-methoxy-6-polyprenyl-1,4-benzoquinol methylase
MMNSSSQAQTFTSEDKSRSWLMFNRIAPTYDLLNRLLSGGVDQRWRMLVSRNLPAFSVPLRVLDLATGTGDQVFALLAADEKQKLGSVVGVDPAESMLALAEQKRAASLRGDRAEFRIGDGSSLRFPDASFHAVTMSFGIRNVPDPLQCLREIHRVLEPGGRALILEFSLPTSAPVRAAYLCYFRKILPWIGGLVSGDRDAYHYLNRTVEEFPRGESFLDWMREAGFTELRFHSLTFGIANLYVGDRAL